MISTFDQITNGRIAVNLIAGQNEAELLRDGLRYSKEERYALMDEEVSIMKALWTSDGPIDHEGRFHTLQGAWIEPKIHQEPHPPFYLGGGSMNAWQLSARHSDVHLFWGDAPERIAQNIREIKNLADEHGRADKIGFGMRLQIVCREREDEAWSAARQLVSKGSEATRAELKAITKNICREHPCSGAGRNFRRIHHAAFVDRHHAGPLRRRHSSCRQSRTVCRAVPRVHRCRMSLILSLGLPPCAGSEAVRRARPATCRTAQSRPMPDQGCLTLALLVVVTVPQRLTVDGRWRQASPASVMAIVSSAVNDNVTSVTLRWL